MGPIAGQRAPSLQVIALDAHEGEPVVLAFVDRVAFPRQGDPTLRQLCAELRGLGAALGIVAEDRVWRFRPDDDFEPCSPRGPGSLRALRADYGAPTGALSLFVLDGSGLVRFAHSIPFSERGDSFALLASALGAAGRSLTHTAPRGRVAISRRELVVTSLLSAFALALSEACKTQPGPAPAPAVTDDATAPPAENPYDLDVTLDVNGAARVVRVDPRVSLLDALRERMGLEGTKKGCDHGQCGACTVLVDGRRVNACLTLAIMAQGSKITTIEGLARGEELHPLQAAFVSEDGFQCGYCTPGQIMSGVGLLAEGHAKTDDEVREHMSGNLCRCGAYPNIVSAIQLARKQVRS